MRFYLVFFALLVNSQVLSAFHEHRVRPRGAFRHPTNLILLLARSPSRSGDPAPARSAPQARTTAAKSKPPGKPPQSRTHKSPPRLFPSNLSRPLSSTANPQAATK